MDLGPELIALWNQWDNLRLINGVAYRKVERPGSKSPSLQALLPINLRDDVWMQLHELPMAGHLGFHKTLAKYRERFYWPGMGKEILLRCKACVGCQQRKSPGKRGRAPLGNVPVGGPFHRVEIDILGPLPKTPRGSKYILVATDMFTKWVEAFPLANIEAKTVAEVLVKEFVCRYGAPHIIHTDQGRQFESALFKEMCTMLGIIKTRSSPYHPQSNGQVERFNRTLLDMLSQWASENQSEWDLVLPLVMLAYRTSRHESTQFSPHYLLFGREVRLPLDLIYSPPGKESGKEEKAQLLLEMRKNLFESHEKVRDSLKAAHMRQKRYYDRECIKNIFKVGDLVWLQDTAVRPGICSKLSRPWKGPYRIIKCLSETVYRIEVINRQKGKGKIVVHANRLKPYVGKDMPAIEKEGEEHNATNNQQGDNEICSGQENYRNPRKKVYMRQTNPDKSNEAGKESQFILQNPGYKVVDLFEADSEGWVTADEGQEAPVEDLDVDIPADEGPEALVEDLGFEIPSQPLPEPLTSTGDPEPMLRLDPSGSNNSDGDDARPQPRRYPIRKRKAPDRYIP